MEAGWRVRPRCRVEADENDSCRGSLNGQPTRLVPGTSMASMPSHRRYAEAEAANSGSPFLQLAPDSSRREYSPQATAALASALSRYVDAEAPDSAERLRAALRTMGTESIVHHATPDRMLDAVTSTWAGLPEVSDMEPIQATIVFLRVVALTLHEYRGAPYHGAS